MREEGGVLFVINNIKDEVFLKLIEMRELVCCSIDL